MPTRILEPGHTRKIRHPVPRGRKVDIYVEASEPVDILILDDIGLEARELGLGLPAALHFRARREFSREGLVLPFSEGDDWYLLIKNSSPKPVAIHYEVDYRA